MKDYFKEFVDNYKKRSRKSYIKISKNQKGKRINQRKINLTSDFGNGWVK